MYPQISLINKKKNILVIFERDFKNPSNEGFIVYWNISKSNHKQLIFKKRLTSLRAFNKVKKLYKDGWIKTTLLKQAA